MCGLNVCNGAQVVVRLLQDKIESCVSQLREIGGRIA